MRVVFRVNFLPHIAKRSSTEGPRRSITMRLDLY